MLSAAFDVQVKARAPAPLSQPQRQQGCGTRAARGGPLVVFTLGAQATSKQPRGWGPASASASASTPDGGGPPAGITGLHEGLRSGVLQKVELRNEGETLSAGCKLFPSPVLSAEGWHTFAGPREHLGTLHYGVFARLPAHAPAKAKGKRAPGPSLGPSLTAMAELKTPRGLTFRGALSPGGQRSFLAHFEVKPRLVRGAFGVVSSALGASLGRAGEASARCHQQLSVAFEEAKLAPPAGRHYAAVPSLPPAALAPLPSSSPSGKASPSRALAEGRGGGGRKEVAIVGGHWIDPGGDTGAPGEREMNRHLADRVTAKLASRGWVVRRPENNAASHAYSWPQYLDWVGDQSQRGTPVVEIHGQGRIGDVPALGVIGDARAPLNAALGRAFGFFPTEYRLRGVPRHGGAIVEAYDTDRFRGMSALQRHEAAEAVSAAIVDSICRWHIGEEGFASRAGCSATGCPVDEAYLQRKGLSAKTY